MNVGRKVFINRIQDYLQSRVVYFLMNLHIRPRSVWLSRVSSTCFAGVGLWKFSQDRY
jgi:6-phosphofructo-2-kinase/fructose-2,6-biphosphatase 2